MDIDNIYQYNFPTIIRFGNGAVKELPAYLKTNKLQKPLLVTDPTVSQLAFFKEILKDLTNNNISAEVFFDIHKNPVKSDVYKGSDTWDHTGRDCVIGIGGGARGRGHQRPAGEDAIVTAIGDGHRARGVRGRLDRDAGHRRLAAGAAQGADAAAAGHRGAGHHHRAVRRQDRHADLQPHGAGGPEQR